MCTRFARELLCEQSALARLKFKFLALVGSASGFDEWLTRKKIPSGEVPLGIFWCGRRELNPYGKTTRPSNVRVCQFRHSRRTVGIISQLVTNVKYFLKSFLIFLKKFKKAADVD